MKYIANLLCLFCIIISFANLNADSIVQGKINKVDEFDVVPVKYAKINLHNQNSDKILMTAFTGSDGIFSFRDVKTGNYVLKILEEGKSETIPANWIIYDVVIPNQPQIMIEPVLINRFKFKITNPKNNQRIPLANVPSMTPSGDYSGLPSSAKIWIILKCINGNYLITSKNCVHLGDRKWVSNDIAVDTEDSIEYEIHFSEILAVLVPLNIHSRFKVKSTSSGWFVIEAMPKDVFILDSVVVSTQ